MHRNAMANGEFHSATIDHLKGSTLGIGRLLFDDRTTPKDRIAIRLPQDQFRLEDPRLVLVMFRLGLIIHKEDRHKPFAGWQRWAHHPLDEHARAFRIRRNGLYRSGFQGNRDLAS